MKDLSQAITKDMAEIRETELDRSGSFKKAKLGFTDSSLSGDADIFVDRLGRVVTPNGEPWSTLETVMFEGDDFIRSVVKKEPRYEGDNIAALVIYLEAKGEDDAAVD